MERGHEIPGHGPTRILALEDGDESHMPHEVEAELRRPVGKKPSRFTRTELLEQFRDDYEASVADRPGCLRDWQQVHPQLTIDLEGIALKVENGPKQLPKVAPSPISPPASRPTVAALGVCAFADVLLTCLLSAMRVGGAISWDWGWVLAPVWVPLAIATIGVVLLGLVLAALDERDAARRRAS